MCRTGTAATKQAPTKARLPRLPRRVLYRGRPRLPRRIFYRRRLSRLPRNSLYSPAATLRYHADTASTCTYTNYIYTCFSVSGPYATSSSRPATSATNRGPANASGCSKLPGKCVSARGSPPRHSNKLPNAGCRRTVACKGTKASPHLTTLPRRSPH